ncbi:hypothetical protein [Roseivirga sp.]|uniref:hypothetical protein n=1 Tax=Roseivirga sp. TaxID=1964215 RepID=UPI002B26AE81|nr:hypothetical protein [Roseivirga sp.]
MKKVFLPSLIMFTALFIAACSDSGNELSEFTGNEMEMALIPGSVEGNTTSGTLKIRERNDGRAQLEITLNDVISGAEHPVHLHFGSLSDNGDVATYLTTLKEVNGVGKSVSILETLDNNITIDYNNLLNFDGSIKIHFETSGPLENEILGSTNIGLNADQNEAYLNGAKSITSCNSNFGN